jgi:hypothetical protein
VLHHQALFLS